MEYSNLMRNAARILFWLAIVIVLVSLVSPFLMILNFGPMSSAGGGFQMTAVLVGILGGITSAVPAFVGAAIVWRLDIWLFERGDKE
ncbi:hypothetical protein GRI41_05905 [Altererythrobacter aquaemixtae]|uniref:Uncharacterized protein n=2 Tax=Pontixanthobacter aquaemixtae TaxID=1958940 RepID=A0A844ZTM2_9SPHN|nr:hypothetical protein [Pontixanthobacter aquaemixtae]